MIARRLQDWSAEQPKYDANEVRTDIAAAIRYEHHAGDNCRDPSFEHLIRELFKAAPYNLFPPMEFMIPPSSGTVRQ